MISEGTKWCYYEIMESIFNSIPSLTITITVCKRKLYDYEVRRNENKMRLNLIMQWLIGTNRMMYLDDTHCEVI